MQTLSLKRQIKGLTIVGYLATNGKVYKHKKTFVAANIKAEQIQHKKQTAKDLLMMLRAATLTAKINKAKNEILNGWTFAKYCLLCSLFKAAKLLKLQCDSLQRDFLF